MSGSLGKGASRTAAGKDRRSSSKREEPEESHHSTAETGSSGRGEDPSPTPSTSGPEAHLTTARPIAGLECEALGGGKEACTRTGEGPEGGAAGLETPEPRKPYQQPEYGCHASSPSSWGELDETRL